MSRFHTRVSRPRNTKDPCINHGAKFGRVAVETLWPHSSPSGTPTGESNRLRLRSLLDDTALEAVLLSTSPSRPHYESLAGSGLFQEFDYFAVIPGAGGSQGRQAVVGLCIDIVARFDQNTGEVRMAAPRRPIQRGSAPLPMASRSAPASIRMRATSA